MKGINILLNKGKRVFLNFVIIGAGANGSHFFRSLLQDLATYKTSYNGISFSVSISLVDGDDVEAKNKKNQLYDDDDIGLKKVFALSERYGDHYGFDINAYPKYVTELEELEELFTVNTSSYSIPILIGMLDNNRTRQLLDGFFHSDFLSDCIYIDAGVEGIHPDDPLSGFSGQVVVGYKRNHQVFLPPVGRVYEDILTDTNTAFPGQSCGDLIVNYPQRCETNKFAAQIANCIVNNLLNRQQIFTHCVDFNAELCGSMPTYIPKEVLDEYNSIFDREESK